MSTISELDLENTKPHMKPALKQICCCSVTAASGFIAAYALVAYAIALIYEIVWVVESRSGLPIASALLMLCYCIVITATIALVHGLISKNNTCLIAWLIAVVLILIPECGLVFYMSISHWGLQGVYGGAELTCYVVRLPAIVCGVVLVQSAYALRESRKPLDGHDAVNASGSEFDASHFVPGVANVFTNDGYVSDVKYGSMPDLRRHLAMRQSVNRGYPIMLPTPPAYWQHYADRQYAASLRGFPKPPMTQMYGTWVGSRPNQGQFKRRHSIVGTFDNEYPGKDFDYPEERGICKSEMGYNYYRQPYPYDYRMCPPEYDPRYSYDYKRNENDYGVNLLRHEPYHFKSPRDRFFERDFRNSNHSVGNESDDLTKYKDVAL